MTQTRKASFSQNLPRKLMLAERLDAATAAFQVGYESPSQFSRMFGAPPLRDISSLRQQVAGQAYQGSTRS